LANTDTFTEMVLDINKIIIFGLVITPLVVTLGKVDLKPLIYSLQNWPYLFL